MRLHEILDMVPVKFNWLDHERAVFYIDDIKYGIFIDYQVLRLPTRNIDVANVSFGTCSTAFSSVTDLNTSITNFGKPRTVLTTVASACLANFELVNSDIICVAASDQAKEKRFNLYTICLSEISARQRQFSSAHDIQVKTSNGTKIILLSKIKFTKDEEDFISEKLQINKF